MKKLRGGSQNLLTTVIIIIIILWVCITIWATIKLMNHSLGSTNDLIDDINTNVQLIVDLIYKFINFFIDIANDMVDAVNTVLRGIDTAIGILNFVKDVLDFFA